MHVPWSKYLNFEVNSIYYVLCIRPDIYWLYQYKSIYLLWCMEWPKTFNEVSGHYKNTIVITRLVWLTKSVLIKPFIHSVIIKAHQIFHWSLVEYGVHEANIITVKYNTCMNGIKCKKTLFLGSLILMDQINQWLMKRARLSLCYTFIFIYCTDTHSKIKNCTPYNLNHEVENISYLVPLFTSLGQYACILENGWADTFLLRLSWIKAAPPKSWKNCSWSNLQPVA